VRNVFQWTGKEAANEREENKEPARYGRNEVSANRQITAAHALTNQPQQTPTALVFRRPEFAAGSLPTVLVAAAPRKNKYR